MKLYVVIKVGTEVPELRGEQDRTFVQCEGSFFNKDKAEEFYRAKNSGSKREIIEDSVCDVVRVIHEVDVMDN